MAVRVYVNIERVTAFGDAAVRPVLAASNLIADGLSTPHSTFPAPDNPGAAKINAATVSLTLSVWSERSFSS